MSGEGAGGEAATPAGFARTIEIRWRDMDAYAHVNNAVYQTYLEEARDAALERLLRDVPGRLDYVLARVAIDFRRELSLADGHVVVAVRFASLGRSSLRTEETIRTPDGEVAAEAEAVVVAIDPTTRRPRPLSAPERAAFLAAGATARTT